jgi:type IV pilus assembly protein PilV
MKQNLKNFNAIKNTQGGAVLLEALIAVLIFSFGILAISGLQAAMVKNTTDSNYRAEANYLVQQQVGRMWANPIGMNTFLTAATGVDVPNLPNGKLIITGINNNTYRFEVQWQTPGQDRHQFVTTASIDVNR